MLLVVSGARISPDALEGTRMGDMEQAYKKMRKMKKSMEIERDMKEKKKEKEKEKEKEKAKLAEETE